MTPFKPTLTLCAALALAACLQEPGAQDGASLRQTAPEDAAPGTCWDRRVTPAVVETVSEDVLVRPAQISPSGTVQSPPVYRKETRQRIVAPRKVDWTQVICPTDLKSDFVASLQRALSARGYYTAPITGQMDSATRAAVLRYQADEGVAGPTPGVLTLEAARRLGLWAVDRARL